MKKVISIATPLILTLGMWAYDGARLAFWATSIEIREEVPVVDGMPELGTQTKVTWLDQFACGIETPLIGAFLSFIIFIFLMYKKRFEKSSLLNGN